MAIKPHVLRKIAASQLEEMFPGQAREAREELITSVVRQWTTYDGNAGIFTVPVHYYLTAKFQDGLGHAGTEVVRGTLREHLVSWGVVESDLSRIAWDLSVAQMATLLTRDGVTVIVHSDPRDHTFRFEQVQDVEDK